MAFYAIHPSWSGPNHVSVTASEAKMALQTSMYDKEKKTLNWEKYVAHHVRYNIILGKFMEYGYQGLDQGSKVQYLLNGIRYDELSTAVTAVRAHPAKYKKDFDAVVTFLNQYINKSAPTPSVKVASVAQTRPVKQQKTSTTHGTFKKKDWVEEGFQRGGGLNVNGTAPLVI